jgi:hypothetical protein
LLSFGKTTGQFLCIPDDWYRKSGYGAGYPNMVYMQNPYIAATELALHYFTQRRIGEWRCPGEAPGEQLRYNPHDGVSMRWKDWKHPDAQRPQAAYITVLAGRMAEADHRDIVPPG